MRSLQHSRVLGTLAIGLFGFVPSGTAAQAVTVRYADLRPNERVHVTSADGALAVREGALFLRAGVDTLFIQRHLMTGSWPVPLHELKGLRVVRGTRTQPIGAIVGLLLGIPVGGIIGLGGCAMIGCDLNRAMGGLLLGALAGGAIGFKLGFGPHDRWVPVILPVMGGR